MTRTAVVLGARNLGGAIVDRLLADGYSVAAVARSDDTLEAVSERGALALRADAADPDALTAALGEAREHFGTLDLVVNAVSAATPSGNGPFGGGPLGDADLAAFDAWTAAVARQAFVFLSTGIRALRAAGHGGALIQITGGSSRRGMPARGLWAAGAFATRAMVQAAAQEVREESIHVALLAVDAVIESPKTASRTDGLAPNAVADMDQIADAVLYLAGQADRGYSHDLTLTPAGERWVP
jgi:NAD(P)-dependent dehydrogenase (short-subunit alcohol dehydrogenase family)